MNKKTLLSLMMLLLASIGMARADEPSVNEGIIRWSEPITTEQANSNQFFDFENGQIPAGWTNDNSYPWTVVSNAYSGYNGTYCIKSGNGGVSSSTSSISTTVNYSQDGTVSFLGGCWGEGTTNIWDKCQFFIDNVEQFSNGALQTWSNYSFIVPAGTHTFRWSYTKDGSVNPTGDAFFIDDVTFNDSGTICLAPSNLTVTNATATSATLSWTENDDSESWYIYYRHNAPIPTPLPYDTVSASVNPFTLTGLVSNAHYEAFVVPACGVGTQDFYQFASNTVDFTPADSYSITVSANLPNAGTVTGGGEYSFGDTCTLTATPNIGYYLYSWMKDDVMIGDYYQDEYTFTVTESANIVANFHQIEYYPYITSMPEGGGWGEIVGLDYATSGAIHYGDAVTLRAIPNEDFRFYKWTMWVGTDNDYYEIDLSTDTLYTFTFDENFVGFDAGNQGEIEFVANFVESIGDCVRPLDLTATEVGPTSATLSWTELGTSQAWMMYYRPAFTPAYVPYDSLEIYQNPYTLTSLQPNTAYEAYIVPSCGFTDGIANEYLASNTVTFTTLEACPAPFNLQVSNITHNSATVAWTGYNDEYTFSYRVATELIDPVFSEDFEGGVIPQGWSNEGDASWEVGVGDYTPDTISAHSGNYNAKITHNNSQEQTYFVMPSMNLGGQNDLVLSFWYINRSWGGDIDELGVYYRFGTEGAQGAWQPLWSTTEAHETWTNQVVELTGLSDNYQIGFLFTDHYGYGVGLDDIVIAHEQVSEWITLSDATNPLELTGLTPGTNYEVKVMGSCDETQTGWSNSAFFTTNDAVYYTITASANPAAGGNVTGGGTYMQGASCTLTATANTGYTFTNWTKNDGTVVSNNATYTFNVTESGAYAANFTLNSYMVTASANPTEGGTVTGGGTYNHGQNITLTAMANEGYTFTGWSDGVTTNPRTITVTGPATYVANFELQSFNITVSADPTEGGTVSGGGTYNYGSSVTLTATPAAGYAFINWTKNGTVVSTNATYILNVTEGGTYVAHFSQNSYTLTINYKFANGTTAAPTHTENVSYGASYSVTSPTITGYTPDQAVVSGTMGAENVTVDVTYSVNSYTLTINYKYANGTTAAPTHTESVNYNATYSVTSPTITGYTPDLAVVTGTMGTENVTVDVTYTINSYTLTVNYLYADGTTAAASHTESVNYNATYSVTSPAITGYTPDLAVVTGTMGTENVTVDVTYTINSYILTVNYLYADGTTAAASHTESVNYNASYSVTSPAITGYTPDLAVVTGTMGTENVTVDVTYTINSYTLTVNYLYADGTTAAASHTESVNYNATYSVTSPAITGYTPDLAVVTGTMGTENVTVDVTYTINSYTLTVNYLYADGTTAAASHTESVNYNATYSVTSPAITGYTPDLAVVTGTMGTENVTVDVTYTINSYILTVNYLYADGTTAAASHTESVNYNASYSVTSPAITGYTPDLAVVTGTMGTENVTVDVTYTINSYILTVNYLYADGTTAAASHTESVNYNATYSVTSPTITGYTPDLAVVSGTMGTENVTVDVTYTINSYILTVNYLYADGTTAAASHTESVNYNASYSVTSPAITGYTPDLAVVTGTMGTENVTVDVTYTINSYVISASANPTVGGSVNGAGTYNHFETAILTATASTGYTFINWTENGTVISTSPTISFMVEGPRTLVANFQLNSYQITAIANPTAGGTATGTGTYNHFESCTLVATPNEYYVFTNWTKNGQVVSDNATYTFTVEGGGTYVAHFTRVNHQITVLANPTEGGSVSGEGSYPHGSYCTLTATANTGYTFFNWTKNGVVVSSNPSYSFPVTEDATYTANFNLNNFLVTVAADPAAGGSVSGGGAYLFGSSCTVSAMANTGYTFTNWTVNGTVVSTDANYTFPVNGNTDLIAHFSLNHYNITVSVDPEVGGSATGGGSFTYGETCTLTATANTGYAFINWTKNGSVVSNNASYSFSVNDGGDYVAHFAVARYTLTVLAEPADGGRVYGGGTYDYGHAVVLRAIANEGYEFINWTKNGDVVSSNANYSVVVREDAEYKAHFQIHTYEIKAHTEPFNTGLITGAGFYNYGDICTLSVDPYDEYEFICWTLDGQVVSEEASFSFVVTEGRDYVAHLQSDGLVEQSGITVSLYPNPARRRLTIEASEPVNMLEIYNINGALVYKQTNCSDKVEINVTTYAPGTYMIRLTTDSTVETRRFVKE